MGGGETLRTVTSEFAADTSCHGIANVERAGRRARIFWTAAVVLAFALMTWQISELLLKFGSFPVTTRVKVENKAQPFPTVTICNLNQFRKSALLSMMDDDGEIEAFRDAYLNLTRTGNHKAGSPFQEDDDDKSKPRPTPEEKTTPAPATDNTHAPPGPATNVTPPGSGLGAGFSSGGFRRRKRNAEDTNTTESPDAERAGSQLLIDSLIDDEEDKTGKRQLQDAFLLSSFQVGEDARRRLGHRLDDLLLHCRFLRWPCSQDDFSLYLDPEYGRCYSFNGRGTRDEPLEMGRSGTEFGLSLILHVEEDEYLPVLSEGRGVRITVHEFGSRPLPDADGQTLAPGFHTDLATTHRVIRRLGHPYGTCQHSQPHADLYTSQLCTSRCVHDMIADNCTCHQQAARALTATLVPACRTEEQVKCLLRVKRDYARQSRECSCRLPCRETEYSLTSTMHEWPAQDFVQPLKDEICREDSPSLYINNSACDSAVAWDLSYARANLVHVKVFFKHLNYESIEEEVEYGVPDLLSDVGGTMGLYAGISFLTGVELLAFLGRLLRLRLAGARTEPRTHDINM